MSRNDTNSAAPCQPADCSCSSVTRRSFVQLAGLGVTASLVAGEHSSAVAGPFTRDDFQKLVPADKKLDPAWVKSLTERGQPEWVAGEALRFIGMPVGGICAGQLYLGGDGRLWHWDLFNQQQGTNAAHYAKPVVPHAPVNQGFALRVTVAGKSTTRTLDQQGFPGVRFRGEYPIGRVEYAADGFPLRVNLEVFSPFIPLDTDSSSLPATIFQFTLHNAGTTDAQVELAGWLENAVALHSGKTTAGTRVNEVRTSDRLIQIVSSVVPADKPAASTRPEIVFEDFEKATYEGWQVEGTAFGPGPIERKKIPAYQGNVGGEGDRVVNSHNVRDGKDVGAGDAHQGKLTSREFKIERKFITFYIGGGNHPGKTCLNVVVDGKVVRTATGHNNNAMRRETLDVSAWADKQARIEIVDQQAGAWGNIGIDQIVFTDKAAADVPFEKLSDVGTLAFGLWKREGRAKAAPSLGSGQPADDALSAKDTTPRAERPLAEKLVGALVQELKLSPNASAIVTFAIAWHFPNLKLKAAVRAEGRYYAERFASAAAVLGHLDKQFDQLVTQTKLWRDTWYDSTLPYWFLDRTMLNTSILASSTCHRFRNGRFYGWEGVGCCEGTCTHVWHYAHAVARLFPDLERNLREQTDFGVAFDPKTGIAKFRGEVAGLAIDGQAGVVLRSYREHQMSADDAFLKRNWPSIKLALRCLIDRDGDGDGIISGGQHNTLDADWFGPVAWLSGLYLAALQAGAAMADEQRDTEFAAECRAICAKGQQKLVATLFDGEYFINQPDPQHAAAINSGTGCEVDQVMGQSWAFQVGLPRAIPAAETISALQSLWKYNFSPDVGPYRAANKPGRWYAMPGEAGLLMCTFPRKDWDYTKAAGKGPDWAAGYFNECMNGFEYQVAGHMLWEGLTAPDLIEKGLAITRAVHDRYAAERRNPYNEIECGDHYARSMASYGIYLAACGFQYHGPRGEIGFAPRVSPDNFRCAFTTATGWGTFAQQMTAASCVATLDVKHGHTDLRMVTLNVPRGRKTSAVKVTLAGQPIAAKLTQSDTQVQIRLGESVKCSSDKPLRIEVT